MTHIYTIPPTVPFLRSFAQGLLELIPQPETLARATVFLPYRRAALELREILREVSPTKSLLLPQIHCLDDVESFAQETRDLTEELQRELREEEAGRALSTTVHPTIVHPLERLGILTNLIVVHQREESMRRGTPQPPFITAVQLAQALVGVLDQAAIEGVDLQRIKTLVEEEFAHHWQITLDFLKIILDIWPQTLAEKKWVEPYVAHQEKIQAILDIWSVSPPQEWMIIAGSTGTMPATRKLIRAIAHLPKGVVVLPGLTLCDEGELLRAQIPTHPQCNLARLLKTLAIDPAAVKPWVKTKENLGQEKLRAREALLKAAFNDGVFYENSEVSQKEHCLGAGEPFSTEGLSLIPCGDIHEESLVIALLLRQTLETPGRRATLISPDPTLARYVKENMKRWGISLRDSSGVPLGRTPLGVLMLLILEGFSDSGRYGGSAGGLLALLKHPLVGAGLSQTLKSGWIGALEKQALRGLKPKRGWENLEDLIPSEAPKKRTLQRGAQLLKAIFSPLREKVHETHPLSYWVALHRTCTEQLVGQGLWNSPEELALQTLLVSLEEKGAAFGGRTFTAYGELFGELLAHQTILPVGEGHPRVQILGTIEARLIQTDVMILGGLNEGVWPTDDGVDPWLSRPMREELGLPSLERRIGLMAHDFCQAFAGEDIFLTRSTRMNGTPTLPSRLLLRLQATFESRGQKLPEAPQWRLWAQELEAPVSSSPEVQPAPCPPLEARPNGLSVTQIETWRRDPYALYARHILKLRPLDPLDQEPSAALLGTLIHGACEQFLQGDQKFSLSEFLQIGESLFKPYQGRIGIKTFWWPRFCQTAEWFVETERKRRAENIPYRTFTEAWGKLSLQHTRGIFTVTARADRIDLFRDGQVELIDYKTGTIPTDADVRAGFSPQLPLEAAIVLGDGFSQLPKGSCPGSLSYWGLYGRDKNILKSLKGDSSELAEKALTDLRDLIELFNNAQMAYRSQPFPQRAPLYSDYTHLARIAAWQEGG